MNSDQSCPWISSSGDGGGGGPRDRRRSGCARGHDGARTMLAR